MVRLLLEQLATNWSNSPETESNWDIPMRSTHPALDSILHWIEKHKRHTDHEVIWLMASIQPANDLTRLCLCLRKARATQGLSDKTCTLLLIWHRWDLDELFWELIKHLCSREGQQTFYEICGREYPDDTRRWKIQAVFWTLDDKWKQHTTQFRAIAMGKFFLQWSETDALYLVTFLPALYQFLATESTQQHTYKDAFQSPWAEELANNPHILMQLQAERYCTPAEYQWTSCVEATP